MPSNAVTPPVVVVGGSVAGMAAAARLAKAGHPVELLEATERLGGRWAPYELDGVQVDDAPGTLDFPAPWRDLFRKSGRPLEAELARAKLALSPAPAPGYVFADGSELVLPWERGEQFYALAAVYGPAVAARWRDVLDELDEVWQAVRPLGLEAELRSRRQLRRARDALRARQTIAQLADQLAEPHLGALVRSVAYRLGSQPELTPAWCAIDLVVQRTFGRWRLTPLDDAGRGVRTSLLVDAMATRLATRKVAVQLGRQVVRVKIIDGRVTGVSCADGSTRPASAVICTVDPWQTYTSLLPRSRRAVRRWVPASAAVVHHRLLSQDPQMGAEQVVLSDDGRPRISYLRRAGQGWLESVHDYGAAVPTPSAGLAWQGFGRWLDRPPIRGEVAGLFLAGPFSRGGPLPSSVVLSGGLASYACQDYLG